MREPFTDTITVYNHFVFDRKDYWLRTVLTGVQWTEKKQNTIDATGKNVFQTITKITIPIDVDSDGKEYVSPYQKILSLTQWTLNPTNGDDVIVKGICPQVIGTNYTLDDLMREFHAVTIMAVSDNTNRRMGKTWKVDCV